MESIVRQLLPLFRTAATTSGCREPWWWPRGYGLSREDWFGAISEKDVEELTGMRESIVLRLLRSRSLEPPTHTGMSRSDKTARAAYLGSEGIWGLGGSGVSLVIVSDRPSDSQYPASGVTGFLKQIHQASWAGAHLTDFFKVRGYGSEAYDGGIDFAGLFKQEIALVRTQTLGRSSCVVVIPIARSIYDHCRSAVDALGDEGVRVTSKAGRSPFAWGGADIDEWQRLVEAAARR